MWLRCPLRALCGEMLVSVDGSGSLDEVSHVQSLYAVGYEKARSRSIEGVGEVDGRC